MNTYLFLLIWSILNVIFAAGVWLQQSNREDPEAQNANPLAWFLIVLISGILGLLLYWALVPHKGPLLKPISDQEIEEWKNKADE